MNILKQKLVNKSLNIQIILLSIIPMFYVITMYIVSSVSEVNIRQYLENDISETVTLLSVSCYLLSAVIINNYKNQPNQKFLLLSYLIIFVSNIINFNMLIVGFMGIYTKNFINLKEIKSYFNKLDNSDGKASMIISILIMLLSMLIAYIKFAIG